MVQSSNAIEPPKPHKYLYIFTTYILFTQHTKINPHSVHIVFSQAGSSNSRIISALFGLGLYISTIYIYYIYIHSFSIWWMSWEVEPPPRGWCGLDWNVVVVVVVPLAVSLGGWCCVVVCCWFGGHRNNNARVSPRRAPFVPRRQVHRQECAIYKVYIQTYQTQTERGDFVVLCFWESEKGGSSAKPLLVVAEFGCCVVIVCVFVYVDVRHSCVCNKSTRLLFMWCGE